MADDGHVTGDDENAERRGAHTKVARRRIQKKQTFRLAIWMESEVRPECREIIIERREEAFARQQGLVHTIK